MEESFKGDCRFRTAIDNSVDILRDRKFGYELKNSDRDSYKFDQFKQNNLKDVWVGRKAAKVGLRNGRKAAKVGFRNGRTWTWSPLMQAFERAEQHFATGFCHDMLVLATKEALDRAGGKKR